MQKQHKRKKSVSSPSHTSHRSPLKSKPKSRRPLKTRQSPLHTSSPLPSSFTSPHFSPSRPLSTSSSTVPPQEPDLSQRQIDDIATAIQALPKLRAEKKLKIKHITSLLQAVDSQQPTREAWWLLASKSKIPERILRLAVKNEQQGVAEPDIELSDLLNPNQLEEVFVAIDNRVRLRKPLQYILGDVDFCKLKLATKVGILIPRPETEHMTTWLTHQIKLYNQYVLYEKSRELDPPELDPDQDPPTDSGSPESVSKRRQTKLNEEIKQLITQKKLFDYTEEKIEKFHGYPLHRFRFSWYDAISDPLSIHQQQRVIKERKDAEKNNPPAPAQTPVLSGNQKEQQKQQHEKKLQSLIEELEKVKIYDLCSGSGNISLSMATQLPLSTVVGVDVDPEALKLARYNKEQLGIKNAKFLHTDLFRNSISQALPPTSELLTAQEYPERTTTFEADDLESETKHAARVAERVKKQAPSMNAGNRGATKKDLSDDQVKVVEPFLGLYDLPMLSSLTDIIVSNPPYIQPEEVANLEPEVKNWENHFALTPMASTYDAPGSGVPYPISEEAISARGLTSLPPWPTKEEVRKHSLVFYERIVKSAPRLLTQNEHFVPRQGIKFPRLVLEIGHEEQALHVANMASYMFDVEVYQDGYDRVRWVVGFEPPRYH